MSLFEETLDSILPTACDRCWTVDPQRLCLFGAGLPGPGAAADLTSRKCLIKGLDKEYGGNTIPFPALD